MTILQHLLKEQFTPIPRQKQIQQKVFDGEPEFNFYTRMVDMFGIVYLLANDNTISHHIPNKPFPLEILNGEPKFENYLIRRD
jgi:hypothetical protein